MTKIFAVRKNLVSQFESKSGLSFGHFPGNHGVVDLPEY